MLFLGGWGVVMLFLKSVVGLSVGWREGVLTGGGEVTLVVVLV
jgi:hypothetical protein